MRRAPLLPFVLALSLLAAASSLHADVIIGPGGLSRAIANSLYCQLSGCTMTGTLGVSGSGVIGNRFPVQQGTGTAQAINGVLTAYGSGTGTGNGADTTEDTIFSYTLPAGTLDTNGKIVRITAFGTFAANGDTKNGRVYFGGTAHFLWSSAASGSKWSFTTYVIRTGAATQLMFTSQVIVGTAVLTPITATPAETLANAVLIKITAQDQTSAVANSMVVTGVIVEVLN